MALPGYHPGKKIPGALKLSSNENPLGPSPKALEAYCQVAHELHRYPDGAGTDLVRALARVHSLDPTNFILGNGSDEILNFAAGLVLEPGFRVVTAKETFSQYRFASLIFGGVIDEIVLTPEGKYDLVQIGQRVRETKAPLVFFCNPNNPTGTWYTHDEVLQFLGTLPESTLVVLDEAYGEYAEDPKFPRSRELIEKFSNLLVTRTFSKIYGIAALRVGYGFGNPSLIENVKRLKSPFNINSPALTAATVALDDEDFVRRSLETNRAGKSRLMGLFDQLKFPYFQTQGNFLCVHTGALGIAGSTAYTFLAERGLTIRDLASFGLPEHIRITIGTNEDNDLVEKLFRELVASLGTRV